MWNYPVRPLAYAQNSYAGFVNYEVGTWKSPLERGGPDDCRERGVFIKKITVRIS